MKVPGSPSSMLTAIRRGAGSPRTMRHLRPAGKAGAAEAAQARVFQRLDHLLDARACRDAVAQQRDSRPPRGRLDSRCTPGSRDARRSLHGARHLLDVVGVACATGFWPDHGRRRLSQRPMQGARDRRARSAPSERRAARPAAACGAGHRARQAVAHAHGDRRRRGLAFLHHVEVVVEGRDLVHLGLRELHLLGQRREVRGREAAEAVLDAVQVLDEVLARARHASDEARDLGAGDGIHGASLGDGRARRIFETGMAIWFMASVYRQVDAAAGRCFFRRDRLNCESLPGLTAGGANGPRIKVLGYCSGA